MTDADTTLAEIEERIRAFCDAREWDQFHGAKDLAIGVVTEASELLEHFRFRTPAESEALLGDHATRREIADEMADVAIFLLRLAQRYGIDLAAAVDAKLARNAQRYPVETSRGNARKAPG